FFPFVTYITGTWFTSSPSFIIPDKPLNRLHGRYWLDSLARHPMLLVDPKNSYTGSFGWIDSNGNVNKDTLIDSNEALQLAFAAKTYFLDGIRYVYDENNSTLDHRKTNTPSRFCFDDSVVTANNTKEYLDWYLSVYNEFYKRFEDAGKWTLGITDWKRREEYQYRLLAIEWTMTRMAVDAFTIVSSDIPYIRKWQFFSFLDGLSGLLKLINKGSSDRGIVLELLGKDQFQGKVQPVLQNIPIQAIRSNLLEHTEEIYKSIEGLGDETLDGPSLLWVYRNSRHGYYLRDPKERKALIKHDGKISDDLPDLCIGLWLHFLSEFSFSDALGINQRDK
ncbi:MAG: hypothetical protein Q8L64_07010, partial [bacterium]|nr:hypothetical protein [bacterium]